MTQLPWRYSNVGKSCKRVENCSKIDGIYDDVKLPVLSI
jgi:hypothetical protein